MIRQILTAIGVVAAIMMLLTAIAIAVTYITILSTAYLLNSDSVKCDGLWCEFQKTMKESEHWCYENRKPINCSEIP